MVLAFFSDFFGTSSSLYDLEDCSLIILPLDKAFYGGLEEQKPGIITLPDASASEMQIFITWCYTGLITTTTDIFAEQLWVLGKSLRSGLFVNAAMFCVFGCYDNILSTAQAATYVYPHTVK